MSSRRILVAHRGVLFLDEFPEMDKGTMEMLRQPLEDRRITISRAGGVYTYPASFLLVAAMNPCPCGYYPDRQKCSCSVKEIQKYQSRISQALLDRIDLRCEVQAAEYEDLTAGKEAGTTSETMQRRVTEAVHRQKERYAGTDMLFNSELGVPEIEKYCVTTPEAGRLLQTAFRTLGLSARGYHHVLRVSRTIADLENEDRICESHVSEALCFRCGELDAPDSGTGKTLYTDRKRTAQRAGKTHTGRKRPAAGKEENGPERNPENTEDRSGVSAETPAV